MMLMCEVPPESVIQTMNDKPSPDAWKLSTAPNGVRVLLLDDEAANLQLRSAILRQHGYGVLEAQSIDEAMPLFDRTDIAVMDYHLGPGEFGTEAAAMLRRRRPHIPIIILSATLERSFGGVEDMHLLKGFSSINDLLNALKSLSSKRRGETSVMDARDFFYSRISLAIGTDVMVQILDDRGTWLHCNERAAEYLGHAREWFTGRSLFDEMPDLLRDWRDVLLSVPRTRETYIDRTRRGLLHVRRPEEGDTTWSILAFPITLHDGRTGVVLTARTLNQPPEIAPA